MSTKASYNWLYTLLIVLGILNFIVFVTVASKYGEAALGYVRDEHFYLGRKGGRYLEVSEAVFRACQIHAASLFVTHPLAIIAAIFNGRSKA